MSKSLIYNAPFNSLSFGQVSYNIARELYKRGIDAYIFPFGNTDITAYKPDDGFAAWLKDGLARSRKGFSRAMPTLKLWHINGAEQKHSDRQVLFTFHETDEPTEEEVNIVNQQDFTFVSSKYSEDIFADSGAKNVGHVSIGFDPDVVTTPTKKMTGVTHWILVGKWEMRKNTTMIIKSWTKKFGGNPMHALTLCVFNPFLHNANQNAHAQLLNSAFEGKTKPFNIQIFNYLKTNEEVNQLYASADIDLSGFSNAEGWGLPAFNMTGLGKWSIVTNCAAHTDWANERNSVLVNPVGKQPCYEGTFFTKGQPFNQGNFFLFTGEQLEKAMDVALEKSKVVNSEGLKIQTEFTYTKTVDKLLEKVF